MDKASLAIDTESSEIKNSRKNIESEIAELEKKLEETQKKLKCTRQEGVPSVGHGMIYTSFLPIGIAILTKLLLGFGDSIVQIMNIPFKGSSIISFYLTMHIFLITFACSLVSKSYYKECERKKESYEVIIEYLKREIEYQKSKLSTLSEDLTVSDEISEDDYYSRSIARQKMIRTLVIYRNKLKNEFDLVEMDKCIDELGITEEEKKDSFQHKCFIMGKKQKH